MQSWALAVCAAMVGGAVLSMMLPSGNMKRVMSFVLNLFFVCALAAPFLTELPKLDLPELAGQMTENPDLSDAAEEETVALAEQQLEAGLEAVFQQNGYNVLDTNIDIDTETEETSVTVTLAQGEEENAQAIERLVQSELGILPQIVYQSGS